MITQDHIKNADYDHELKIMGRECKGARINVNGQDVMISVDKETGELVHHEVVNPKPVDSDWTQFANKNLAR